MTSRLWLLALITSVVAVGCAKKPIVLETFSGTRSIQEGEAAQMFWKFRYADSVRLDPVGSYHLPEGHAVVVPTATTEYALRAFRAGGDTLVHTWKIAVAPRQGGTGSDISTGPVAGKATPLLIRNESPSAWMRGASDRQAEAVSVRIVGAVQRDNRLVYDCIVLDAMGNALSNDQLTGQWFAEVTCRTNGASESTSAPPANHTWTTASPAVAAVVCVDNSLISNGLAKPVVNGLQQVLPGLPGTDSLGLLVYDHAIVELSPITKAADAGRASSPELVPPVYGLTGMYAAAMNALSMLSTAPNSERLLIVVAASNDNASLQHSHSTVVERARSLGVRIHTVRVGPSAMGYLYRSMAAATGGRSYALPSSEAASAGEVIREVLFAHRQHLRGSVRLPKSDAPCEMLSLKVGLVNGGKVVADSIRLPLADLDYRTPYLAVALFADSTMEMVRAFYPSLALLAEELIENPESKIELIGHAGRDVVTDAVPLGYERARSVADALMGWGVPPKSIQVRSEGSSKPLYYFQLEEWQRRMNNRVEIRRVTVDPTPYIIVVDQVASEEQAEKAVGLWKDRNFKAYFEPVMTQRNPAYKVVLWGYATYDDALRVSRDVAKRFKVQASVE